MLEPKEDIGQKYNIMQKGENGVGPRILQYNTFRSVCVDILHSPRIVWVCGLSLCADCKVSFSFYLNFCFVLLCSCCRGQASEIM